MEEKQNKLKQGNKEINFSFTENAIVVPLGFSGIRVV